MKIISKPNFYPAKCVVCSTFFEVESGDTIIARHFDDNGEIKVLDYFCECPMCGTRVRLTQIPDEMDEQYKAFKEMFVEPMKKSMEKGANDGT